jgi:hypothetical protein
VGYDSSSKSWRRTGILVRKLCGKLLLKAVAFLLASFSLASCTVTTLEPKGDWRIVKAGNWQGVEWKLLSTEQSENGTCLNLETTASKGEASLDSEDNYRGRPPFCLFQPGQGVGHPYVNGYGSLQDAPLDGEESPFGYLVGLTASSLDELGVIFESEEGDGVPVEQKTDVGDGFLVLLYDKSLRPKTISFRVAEQTVECAVKLNGAAGNIEC